MTTSEVLIASTRADAEAVEVIAGHHATLAGGLSVLVGAVVAAIETGDGRLVDAAREDLVTFCRSEVIPHALAEEATLYPAAADLPALKLLVGVLTEEHTRLAEIVGTVATASSTTRLAASVGALDAMFRPHAAVEEDLLLPRLAADPATSLADLLAAMHDRPRPDLSGRGAAGAPAGQHDTGPASSAGVAAGSAVGAVTRAGGCSCGGEDDAVPELDVRTIPHAIRHASVFGAFDAVPAGGALVLVAPHDPRPLLLQLVERAGGTLQVDYLERGPEAWRLKLTK